MWNKRHIFNFEWRVIYIGYVPSSSFYVFFVVVYRSFEFLLRRKEIDCADASGKGSNRKMCVVRFGTHHTAHTHAQVMSYLLLWPVTATLQSRHQKRNGHVWRDCFLLNISTKDGKTISPLCFWLIETLCLQLASVHFTHTHTQSHRMKSRCIGIRQPASCAVNYIDLRTACASSTNQCGWFMPVTCRLSHFHNNTPYSALSSR